MQNKLPNMRRIPVQIQQIMTEEEEIKGISVGKRPINRIANITPKRFVIVTNKRFLLYTLKLLGGAEFEDYRWRKLRDVRLQEGPLRATLTFEVIPDGDITEAPKTLVIHHLPKVEARSLYKVAQKMEEEMLEERRRRELEEQMVTQGRILIDSAGRLVKPDEKESARVSGKSPRVFSVVAR